LDISCEARKEGKMKRRKEAKGAMKPKIGMDLLRLSLCHFLLFFLQRILLDSKLVWR